MVNNWQCPRCGALNSKPDYLLKLTHLSEKMGGIRIGTTSAPIPQCPGCSYEPDVNDLLNGALDSNEAAQQVLLSQKETSTPQPSTVKPKLDYLPIAILGGVLIAVLCLGAAGIGVGVKYFTRPQPTQTATRTRVPTARPTRMATPEPQVRMLSPAEAQRIMEDQAPPFLAQAAIEDYSSEELSAMNPVTYTIPWSESDFLAWGMGWCTTTQTILHQNFEHITYTFKLEGQEIPLDRFVEIEYFDEDMGGYCREYYTVLADWQPGSYLLETVIKFDRKINDGWDDYPASTRTYKYTVKVSR